MKFMDPLCLYEKLLKARAAKQGSILGLHLGDKLVGLAISDPDNKLALPLGLEEGVIVRDKTDLGPMAVYLQEMISKESLSALVIGHPLYIRGNEPRVAEVRQFVYELSKTGKLEDVHYTFYNDSWCTKIAEHFVKPYKFDPTVAEQQKSMWAASSLLQAYLDDINPDLDDEKQDK